MESRTKVVLLGTGTPNPVPARSGPCSAVIVDDKSYIVDFGPGIVRRAETVFRQKNIIGLKPKNLKIAFLTHLHSDHTVGYPDLIFTPWVMERDEPLKVFGPKGTSKMTEHIMKAYEVDIDGRMNGLEQANSQGVTVIPTDITEGIVYKDELVKVEAFLVNHPPFESFGYRFTTPDKVVVISGDTTPNENLIKHAKDCDILVHEVYSGQGIKDKPAKWYKYHTSVHTSSYELGEVARRVNPKLLVTYHQLFMVGDDETAAPEVIENRVREIISEIKEKFDGEVVSGNDFDVF